MNPDALIIHSSSLQHIFRHTWIHPICSFSSYFLGVRWGWMVLLNFQSSVLRLPDHRNTFWSFTNSWLITGFVTRVPRRVPLVEQELLTLPGHLSSSPVFSGVRVTRSLVSSVPNVREHRSDNQKWKTQRNWQLMVHKTNKKSYNIICNENHYAQAYTNKVNMTRALLQTTGGKDQPNIVLYGNRTEHHNTELIT